MKPVQVSPNQVVRVRKLFSISSSSYMRYEEPLQATTNPAMEVHDFWSVMLQLLCWLQAGHFCTSSRELVEV